MPSVCCVLGPGDLAVNKTQNPCLEGADIIQINTNKCDLWYVGRW